MSALFKIAIRNLLKNRRRSTNAVLAIALGFAAVNRGMQIMGGEGFMVENEMERL